MVRDNSQTQQQAGMFANMPMQPVQPLPPAQPIPAPPNSVALPPGLDYDGTGAGAAARRGQPLRVPPARAVAVPFGRAVAVPAGVSGAV